MNKNIPWTMTEIKTLKELITLGCGYDEIAEELPRHSRAAIKQRTYCLGMKLLTPEQRVLEAYKQNKTLNARELADFLNMPHSTVGGILWKNGLSRVKYKQDAIKEYLDSKPEAFWGTQEFIAMKFDCCVSTVRTAIKNWRCEHAKMDD